MKNVCFLLIFPIFGYSQISDRPNVVLFMADDMGMGDTSAYQFYTKNSDDQQVHTPAMEKLASMGMLFTDAHTPSSRCTPTRYGLLTGRYPWRARMKHWVLFGVQGDPLIEEDRPTLATLFRSQGYATAMVGKWHLGLRYSQSNGKPAAGWEDADLTKDVFDGPCDHGFDYARFTSRSHGTSGPDAGTTGPQTGKNKKGNRNTPNQSIGPGHIHNRKIIGATGNGKKLVEKGKNAYDLHDLGNRHSNHAIEFLTQHLRNKDRSFNPFFLYYPSNSNHGPYTVANEVGGKKVRGAGKMVSGASASTRLDYIYENDVALGRLINYLEQTKDPRRPSKKLIENTIIIFTSDNGAEVKTKTATGPVRSNKGSCYEGGHRVPFLVAWPDGKVGNGKTGNSVIKSDQLIGLQDLYATFSKILGINLPELRDGKKGAEDSYNILPAWQGKKMINRPMFYNDHKEGKNGASCAMRLDDPVVEGQVFQGKWKLFFDDTLLRNGRANPTELFELSSDPMETKTRLKEENLKSLIKQLVSTALLHRNVGGHRFIPIAPKERFQFDWRKPLPTPAPLTFFISVKGGDAVRNEMGLGIQGLGSPRVEPGEAFAIRFQSDVLIESVGITAGNKGSCGGSLQMGNRSPLAIYCTDTDNDAKDQTGIISDLGILKKGEILILDPSPHFGVEPQGSWKLESIAVRPFTQN
ncbi:arylsulfatase [Opitutales bacterium]|nr:arylsulfatase [Opitutales bacterium]